MIKCIKISVTFLAADRFKLKAHLTLPSSGISCNYKYMGKMEKYLRVFIFFCAVKAVFLSLSGCTFQDLPPSSVLILVVDSLGFDSVSCHQKGVSVQKSGFHLFCQSSIRFHHAYTPSVLAQPALTSLLTGLYPYEHGVWSNGSHFLSSQFKTLPEVALKRGYRSSFFSGGGAVWRKSGLSQGFEVFDDNVPLDWKQAYRPAGKNIQLFLKWLDQYGKHRPFFSILYLPDLQFPLFSREEKVGDLQSLQIRSRKNILDQSIYELIQELKKRKKWHSTYVLLIGTKGQERYQSFRQNEIPAWSLFSDNTRISLFIKGPSKFRKKARYGNINTPVTLVDVGWTLFDLLGGTALQRNKTGLLKKKLFPVLSFKPYLAGNELNQKKSDRSDFQSGLDLLSLSKSTHSSFGKEKIDTVISDRALLMESGWPLWRKAGSSRFAVRKGPYLFIYDEVPQMYNSLTDRQELSPLSSIGSHPNLLNLRKNFLSYFNKMGVKPWKTPDSFLTEKMRIGKKIFSLSPFQSSVEVQDQLRILMKKNPDDLDLIGWRVELALRNKQWKVLKSFGEKTENFYWRYVANRHLSGGKGEEAKTDCERLFKKEYNGDCEDKSLLSLYEWIHSKEESKDKKHQSRFFYFYLKEKRNQKISHLNQRAYLVWDTHFAEFQKPLLSDMFLNLPENKKYLKIVKDVLF